MVSGQHIWQEERIQIPEGSLSLTACWLRHCRPHWLGGSNFFGFPCEMFLIFLVDIFYFTVIFFLMYRWFFLDLLVTLLNLFVIFLDLMVKVLDFSAKGFGFIRSHGLREFVRKTETKVCPKDNPPPHVPNFLVGKCIYNCQNKFNRWWLVGGGWHQLSKNMWCDGLAVVLWWSIEVNSWIADKGVPRAHHSLRTKKYLLLK